MDLVQEVAELINDAREKAGDKVELARKTVDKDSGHVLDSILLQGWVQDLEDGLLRIAEEVKNLSAASRGNGDA